MDQAVYTCRDSVSGGAPVWEVGRSGQVTRTGWAGLLSDLGKAKREHEERPEGERGETHQLHPGERPHPRRVHCPQTQAETLSLKTWRRVREAAGRNIFTGWLKDHS